MFLYFAPSVFVGQHEKMGLQRVWKAWFSWV